MGKSLKGEDLVSLLKILSSKRLLAVGRIPGGMDHTLRRYSFMGNPATEGANVALKCGMNYK